jgi:hypothetical protein
MVGFLLSKINIILYWFTVMLKKAKIKTIETKKSFKKMIPRANVIKLFTAVNYEFS